MILKSEQDSEREAARHRERLELEERRERRFEQMMQVSFLRRRRRRLMRLMRMEKNKFSREKTSAEYLLPVHVSHITYHISVAYSITAVKLIS